MSTATALAASGQATFTVTVLTDAATGVASNCSNQALGGSLDAACSLRDALAAAAAVNGSSGTATVTVNFAASLAAVGNPGSITLGANALTLPTYTTVQGLTAGSGNTLTNLITIQGNAHIAFSADSSVNHAGLNNLTFTNGAPALSSAAIVTVSQCTFARNSTYSGGAIYNAGTLTVVHSTFTGNTATTYGAAIYSSGTDNPAAVITAQNLMISGSTFQGNSSAYGGAIYIGRDSVGSVDSSTFTGNSASQDGAAIYINNASGLSRVTDSILSGDTGGTECSGFGCSSASRAFVFAGSEPNGTNESGTITMTVTLSTGQIFTINGGYGQFSSGASLASLFGAYISSGYYPLSAQGIGSTLVVGTQSGTITSVVFNIPSAYFTATPVPNSVVASTGNLVAAGTAAANLSQLSNHGGPTQTVLPLPGSVALCTITPANATGTDQRGLPRTTAFGTTLCQDSGAVQTNYGLAFVQQPGPTTVNQVLAPAPSVQVTESGLNFAQPNELVTIKDLSSSLNGTTSSSTVSTGIASFPNLAVTKALSAETLTASLTIGANAVLATSNAFTVSSQPTATLTGSAIFPSTAVNGSSSQVLTLTNTGSSAISISTLSVAAAPEFTQSNTCGLTLPAQASCAITITFSPAVTGMRSGTLTIASNASGYTTPVALTGTGASPSLTLVDGTTGVTSTAITVSSGGTATGTVKASSPNGFAGSIAFTCAAQGAAPTGASCNVTSVVALVTGGTATATITITTTSRTKSAGLGAPPRRGLPAYLVLLALLSVALVGLQSGGRLTRAGSLLLLVFACSIGITGCGSTSSVGANSSGTPAGMYTYIVTATGNGVIAIQPVAVTVQ